MVNSLTGERLLGVLLRTGLASLIVPPWLIEEADIPRDDFPATHLATVPLPLIAPELSLDVYLLTLDKVLSAALAERSPCLDRMPLGLDIRRPSPSVRPVIQRLMNPTELKIIAL
jgi:hypothetical protein